MEKDKNNSTIPMLIIGAFVLFALFIGYFVYQANQVDLNLVRDDYYQEASKHDAFMDDVKRANASNIEFYYDAKQNGVILKLPDNFNNNEISGEINFYRPSDSHLDFTVPVQLKENFQFLNTQQIAGGKWQAKSTLKINGANYFKEITFIKR